MSICCLSSLPYDALAWYLWDREGGYLRDFPVKAGDAVRLTATAWFPTSGTALIENLTTGQKFSHTMSSEVSLCQDSAEWMFQDIDVLLGEPFKSFSTIVFTNASATTTADGKVTPAQAHGVAFRPDRWVMTSTSVSDSKVTITYVGDQWISQ